MRYLLLLLFLYPTFVFAQATQQKVERQGDYKDTYSVLQSNPNIKHGEFIRTTGKTLIMKGQYDNNRRAGIWEFYEGRNNLVQKIDFTNWQVLFNKSAQSDSTYEIADSTGAFYRSELDSPPFFIGGVYAMYKPIARQINYPDMARRLQVQGKVLISCEVTEDGKLVNERVVEGIGSGCDEEALRVIQLVPDEWVPGIKNGKPVRTKITLPLAFKLG